MANIKLDLVTNRVVLVKGQLVIQGGIDDIAQDLKTRLQTVYGEWFLDTRIGIPYFTRILGQKPRLALVKTIFKKAIQSTPGVIRITEFSMPYNGVTRSLNLTFSANTVEGPLTYNKELIV